MAEEPEAEEEPKADEAQADETSAEAPKPAEEAKASAPKTDELKEGDSLSQESLATLILGGEAPPEVVDM